MLHKLLKWKSCWGATWLATGMGLALGDSAGTCQACVITYTVDPNQSTLLASGTYGGSELQTYSVYPLGSPTPVTSLDASYSGTVTAERNLAAGSIEITGGNIGAQNNGYILSSPPDPPSPDNYSFTIPAFGASLPGVPSNVFAGAIRDFSFSLLSPLVTLGDGFNTSVIYASVASGEFDGEIEYGASPSTPTYFSSPISGDLTLTPNNISLSDINCIETLSIPISASLTVPTTDGPLDLNFMGNIVATASVPEPADMVPAFALCALVSCGRRRNRVAHVVGFRRV